MGGHRHQSSWDFCSPGSDPLVSSPSFMFVTVSPETNGVQCAAPQVWSWHRNLTLTSKVTHPYPCLPLNKVSHSKRSQNAVFHAFPWCQAPVSFQTELRSCPTYLLDRELLLSTLAAEGRVTMKRALSHPHFGLAP